MYFDPDMLTRSIENCADFPIYVETEFDPDVIFDIVFAERVNQNEVKKITKALQNFFIRYNRWHFKPIHYVSSMWGEPPEQINAFTIQIHIDFGGANPSAFIGAVKAIARSGANIYSMTLQ